MYQQHQCCIALKYYRVEKRRKERIPKDREAKENVRSCASYNRVMTAAPSAGLKISG
jgi:cell division protein FtsL